MTQCSKEVPSNHDDCDVGGDEWQRRAELARKALEGSANVLDGIALVVEISGNHLLGYLLRGTALGVRTAAVAISAQGLEKGSAMITSAIRAIWAGMRRIGAGLKSVARAARTAVLSAFRRRR